MNFTHTRFHYDEGDVTRDRSLYDYFDASRRNTLVNDLVGIDEINPPEGAMTLSNDGISEHPETRFETCRRTGFQVLSVAIYDRNRRRELHQQTLASIGERDVNPSSDKVKVYGAYLLSLLEKHTGTGTVGFEYGHIELAGTHIGPLAAREEIVSQAYEALRRYKPEDVVSPANPQASIKADPVGDERYCESPHEAMLVRYAEPVKDVGSAGIKFFVRYASSVVSPGNGSLVSNEQARLSLMQADPRVGGPQYIKSQETVFTPISAALVAMVNGSRT